MKIFIALALLAVTTAFALPAAPLLGPQDDDSQVLNADPNAVYETPSFLPLIIEPAFAKLLNEVGEIDPEQLEAYIIEAQAAGVAPSFFVDSPVEPRELDVADAVLVADAPLEEDAESADAVDAVLLADAPLVDDAEVAEAIPYVDAPLEDAKVENFVDSVLVADAPLEEDADVAEAVPLVDAPLEDAKVENFVDSVLVADAPAA